MIIDNDNNDVTLISAWNATNQSFTARAAESAEAHSKLQSQLSLTMQVKIFYGN